MERPNLLELQLYINGLKKNDSFDLRYGRGSSLNRYVKCSEIIVKLMNNRDILKLLDNDIELLMNWLNNIRIWVKRESEDHFEEINKNLKNINDSKLKLQIIEQKKINSGEAIALNYKMITQIWVNKFNFLKDVNEKEYNNRIQELIKVYKNDELEQQLFEHAILSTIAFAIQYKSDNTISDGIIFLRHYVKNLDENRGLRIFEYSRKIYTIIINNTSVSLKLE